MRIPHIGLFVIIVFLVCPPRENIVRADGAVVARLEEQYRARQRALSEVKREAKERLFSFDELKCRFDAKRRVLAEVVAAAKVRQVQIQQAKQRALAEVRALAEAARIRKAAEQRAMAAALKILQEENPNYMEYALSEAARVEQEKGGRTVGEIVDLPVLAKALPMNYHQDLMTSPQPAMYAKTTDMAGMLRPTASHLEQREIMRRLSLRAVDQEQWGAFVKERKQQALNSVVAMVREVRAKVRRLKVPIHSQTDQLADLLDLFMTDKIPQSEYFERRKEILGDQD